MAGSIPCKCAAFSVGAIKSDIFPGINKERRHLFESGIETLVGEQGLAGSPPCLICSRTGVSGFACTRPGHSKFLCVLKGKLN